MPKVDEATAAARPGRGLRIALALSVALNLGVAGVVLGALLHDRPRSAAAVRDLGFGPFTGALTDDDRRSLRAAMLARGPDLRAARREMRDDMAAAVAALRADPFVPEAFRRALDRTAARTVRLLEAGHGLLYDHVVAMTPAERLALADRLEALRDRRGGPDRRGGKDGRGGQDGPDEPEGPDKPDGRDGQDGRGGNDEGGGP